MTYEEFSKFIQDKCMYETIYDDSEGRTILVIRMLDVYSVINKAQRTWVGLTDEDLEPLCNEWRIVFGSWAYEFAKAIEAKLKEKNNG